MYRSTLVFMLLVAFFVLGAKGCEFEAPEDPQDEWGDSEHSDDNCDDPDSCDSAGQDWDSECSEDDPCVWGEGSCQDIGWEYFGPCDVLLGWAVASGVCQPISGCDPGDFDFDFFETEDACMDACFPLHVSCDELVEKHELLVADAKGCQDRSECRLIEDFTGCVDAVHWSFDYDEADELHDIYSEKDCPTSVCDNDNVEFEVACVHGSCSAIEVIKPPWPTCIDFQGKDFGACAMVLGYGIVDGDCVAISGCDAIGFTFFENASECEETCHQPTDEQLCTKTNGMWDEISCGHYHCGQFPACDAIVPGCNCGEGRNFEPEKGCVEDPACTPTPTCDDLADVDFGDCEMAMGVGIVNGQCTMISGCDPLGYGFFESMADCFTSCERCTNDDHCAEGQFCDFKLETNCGQNGHGACTPKPDGCYALFNPVCGCDGNTYGNSCEAARNGISVSHEGACEPPPQCATDADCYLFANFCGTCKCMALAFGDPVPMCPSYEYNYCLINPCVCRKAACIEGSCRVVKK